MRPVRSLALLVTLLLGAAALAGCAEPAATDSDLGLDDPGYDDPAYDDSGEAPADDPATGEGGESASESWDAFRDFDNEVSPRSGGSGKVVSYDYRFTQTNDEKTTIRDVHVEVLDPLTRDVRADKMRLADGGVETETVSTPVELRPVRHTVTIVQDDTGEYAAGDVSTITYYFAVHREDAEHGFNGYFVMATFGSGDAEGSVEYYVTPEMQAAAEEEGATYTIHAEGEIDGDWWGHTFLLGAYGGAGWFTYYDGDFTEEEEVGFGGFSSKTERAVLEAGEYTFDGWRSSVRSEQGDDFAAWSYEVAPDLPVPFSYRIESRSSGDHSLMLHELTDLVLG